MNNQDKFSELRKKYPEFIYEKYDISFKENNLEIKYHFTIPGLTSFYPEIKIPKEYIKEGYNEEYLEYLDACVNLSKVKGKIEFKNVWFSYDNEKWVLKNVSFTIEPRSKCCISGKNGLWQNHYY